MFHKQLRPEYGKGEYTASWECNMANLCEQFTFGHEAEVQFAVNPGLFEPTFDVISVFSR